MRQRLFTGFLLAAVACAQDLPKFEVAPSRWRLNNRPVQVVRQLPALSVPAAKCAIRLRELPTPVTGNIQVIQPDPQKRFSAQEVKVPAEACAAR